jgi:hypothetical protein
MVAVMSSYTVEGCRQKKRMGNTGIRHRTEEEKKGAMKEQ